MVNKKEQSWRAINLMKQNYKTTEYLRMKGVLDSIEL